MVKTRRRKYESKAAQARQSLIDYLKMALVVAVVAGIVIGIIQIKRRIDRDDPPISLKADTFLQGVYVYGTSMGGLTFDEGVTLMEQQVQNRLSTPITVSYQDKTWQITPAELDAEIKMMDQLSAAHGYGNVGSTQIRRDQVQYLQRVGREDFDEPPEFDDQKLEAFVAAIKEAVDVPPTNASVVADVDQIFRYYDHKDGVVLNTQTLKDQITDAIRLGSTPNIQVVPDVWEPTYTRAMMEEATVLISSCTTNATSSTEERVWNIKRALRDFNPLTLQPGEIVSFNRVVGVRSLDNGFYKAPEFLEGNTVEGVGGGTCQASSTLYVALREANVAIIERWPHSQRVAYTNPSKDSTVTDSGLVKDLKFMNDSEYPMYVYATVTNTECTVKVYGKRPEHKMKLISKKIATITPRGYKKKYDKKHQYVLSPDDPLVVFKEGKDGYKSEGWIQLYDWDTNDFIEEYSVTQDEYNYVQPTMWVYYDPAKANAN